MLAYMPFDTGRYDLCGLSSLLFSLLFPGTYVGTPGTIAALLRIQLRLRIRARLVTWLSARSSLVLVLLGEFVFAAHVALEGCLDLMSGVSCLVGGQTDNTRSVRV